MDLNRFPADYKDDIEAANIFLKGEGCSSVYIFGSLVTGKFHDKSDIDIGISGLPPGKFFKVYSRLDGILKKKIDLVDFDEQKEFYDLLCKLGEVVEIG
jgi:predicted nucleotidyltransferase